MKYLNKKFLILALSSFVLLNATACSNKEDTNEEIDVDSLKKDIENEVKDEIKNDLKKEKELDNKENINNNTTNVEKNYKSENENIDNSDIEQLNINNEKDLINYVVKIDEEINNYLESEEASELKNQVINKFITIIDFVFFDGEIGGYKFEQLTDETKQKIIEICNNIDFKIENKYPGYKDTLELKYQDISAKIKSKYNEISIVILEKLKQKIGEDDYNNLNNEIDNAKENAEKGIDYTKEAASKVKEKTLNWYNNLKNNY